jgi:hypothetical protein
VASNSCTVTGQVIDEGDESSFLFGFCAADFANPSLGNGMVIQANSTDLLGEFTSDLTDLVCGTDYYVWAFIMNSADTAYGKQLNFSTLTCGSKPDVSISSISNITYNSAQGGGVISSDGGSTATARGICWSTSQNPSTSDAHTTDGNGTGSYVSSITGLLKAYCHVDNNSANKADYGLLYTWAAAMNGASSSTSNPSGVQGVCPSGWHFPSDEEWKILEMTAGMSRSQADGTSFRV